MPTATRDSGARPPRYVRSLRWILFALLIASAALTLGGLPELERAVAGGRWPRVALAAPAIVLGIFIVGYAAYRFALVRAGRYPAGKTLVQLGLMLLVLGLVHGLARERARGPGVDAPVDLRVAMRSSDPATRAMAVELLRYRPREAALAELPGVVSLLDDPSLEVRRQARATLVALAGGDPGGEGPGAVERWRAYWRELGMYPR